MPTKRRQIIDALTAVLQGIDGMAGAVAAWQLPRLANDSLPFIVLRDTQADIATDGATIGAMEQRLTVQVICSCVGPAAEDDARELGQRALAAVMADPTLGGVVNWIEPLGHTLVAEQGEKRIGELTIDFSATYYTTLTQI